MANRSRAPIKEMPQSNYSFRIFVGTLHVIGTCDAFSPSLFLTPSALSIMKQTTLHVSASFYKILLTRNGVKVPKNFYGQ